MIDKKYQIIADFDIHDMMSEYLDVCRIDFQRLDLKNQQPLIDVIRYKASNTKPILCIIKWKTLERLLAERSPHNDFKQMCLQNRIKVLINSSEDPFFNFQYGLKAVKHDLEYDLPDHLGRIFDGFGSKHFKDIQQLKLDILINGSAGHYLTDRFANWRFVEIGHWFERFFWSSHIYHLKEDHAPEHTFFSLIRFQENCREHRQSFYDAIKDRPLFDQAFIRTTGGHDDPPIHQDPYDYFPSKWLDSLGTRSCQVPMLEYYKKSCFEVVCETYGDIPNDDSFYVTEKICKPILMKHPFVVVGNKNYLENLRSIGFKTFDGLIDESYDSMNDHKQRAEAISNLLSDLDLEKSKKFYRDSRDICEHNQKVLLSKIGRYKFDLWNNLKLYFDSI